MRVHVGGLLIQKDGILSMEKIKQRSRYRNYLSVQVVVMIGVMASFKLIPEKQVAAVVAGLLFLVSSLGILYFEMKHADYKKRFTFWGTLAFVLACAIPILALRLLNWGVPFEELSVLGIPGPEIHKFSNYMFFLMVICLFVDISIERQKAAKSGL